MSIHGVLGEHTHYPKTYAPHILYPIARSLGRSSLPLSYEQLSIGMDFWHCFEVSWLNAQGVSQVAMARLTIPASSPFIIESKSLKLYLNSLNFTEFAHINKVKQTIAEDLSACLQNKVHVELFDLQDKNALAISYPTGELLDNLTFNDKILLTDDVNSAFLTLDKTAKDNQTQHYYSHLLRSNCPVTNQPDWGTVEIVINSPLLDRQGLLKYLLSFRQHNGFHEQCVEQIFADFSQKFHPKSLMVRAWYTRRGGIDINPVRVSDILLLPKASRLVRQ